MGLAGCSSLPLSGPAHPPSAVGGGGCGVCGPGPEGRGCRLHPEGGVSGHRRPVPNHPAPPLRRQLLRRPRVFHSRRSMVVHTPFWPPFPCSVPKDDGGGGGAAGRVVRGNLRDVSRPGPGCPSRPSVQDGSPGRPGLPALALWKKQGVAVGGGGSSWVPRALVEDGLAFLNGRGP